MIRTMVEWKRGVRDDCRKGETKDEHMSRLRG